MTILILVLIAIATVYGRGATYAVQYAGRDFDRPDEPEHKNYHAPTMARRISGVRPGRHSPIIK